VLRPVGRPSHKSVVWYKGSLYQAASWKTARRVVAKVEFHFGELAPACGIHRDQSGDGQPGGRAVNVSNSAMSGSRLLLAGMQMVYVTPRASSASLDLRLCEGRVGAKDHLLSQLPLPLDLRRQQFLEISTFQFGRGTE